MKKNHNQQILLSLAPITLVQHLSQTTVQNKKDVNTQLQKLSSLANEKDKS